MANSGIGQKTLAESYKQVLHLGNTDGLLGTLSQLCTSEGAQVNPSALWLGQDITSAQNVLIKAQQVTGKFFSIEKQGTVGGEGLTALDCVTSNTKVTLNLYHNLEVFEGSSGDVSDANYDGGSIKLGDGKHSIYFASGDTYFDNGSEVYGNAAGTFIFPDSLRVGDMIFTGGTTNSISGATLSTDVIGSTQSFHLQGAVSQPCKIHALDTLELGGSEGTIIGNRSQGVSPSITAQVTDDTSPMIKIDALATEGSQVSSSVLIGTDTAVLAGQMSNGTSLIQVGQNDDTDSSADSINFTEGGIQTLLLKAPKTMFDSGCFYMDIKPNTQTAAVYPTFLGAGLSAGEGVISMLTSASGNPFSPSKLSDEDRTILLVSDGNNSTHYEVDKYEVGTGRVSYYHNQTSSPTDIEANGDAKLYAKDNKFVINTKDASDKGWFYLDLNLGGGSGVADNTIQEAQPTAMSSVDNSGGSISETEYNDLRADVVALRSTVAALMTELKTFRLWKEAGGDI